MKTPVAATRTTIIFEGDEARQRAAEIGLDRDVLSEVVRRGENARAGATENDPVMAASWDAYRHRVRGLRDLFFPMGCTRDRESNLELLRTADGRRAVITRAGDSGVGHRNAHPQPRRAVGEQTANVVDSNATLLLDPDWMNVLEEGTKLGVQTWMLLVYRDGDLVRSELSCPDGTTSDDRVKFWSERILLPEIDFASDGDRGENKDDEAAEIPDVPVARRR